MSFSDLMSSGRGPGVIGMLLALVVLVGFGLLFMFAFDEGMQGKDQSIESMIAHDVEVIENLTGGIARGEKELVRGPSLLAKSKELGVLKTENRIREGGIDSLKKGIATANEAIAAKNKDFEVYKDEFRSFVRGKAKGQTMERLETRRGDVYENVSIREVNAIGMQIMHSGGQKRIAFEELSDEIQDQFQFDPKQKAAAVAVEIATRNVYDAAVSVAGETASQQAAEQKKKEAAQLRERTIRAIAVKRSRFESLEKEIEVLQKDIRAEAFKPIGNTAQLKRRLENKQLELAALRSDLTRLESGL